MACFTAGAEYLLWFKNGTGKTRLWRRTADGGYKTIRANLPPVAHACGIVAGRDFYLGLHDWSLQRFNVDDCDLHPLGNGLLHENTVKSLRISPCGRYLATASYDGVAAVLSLEQQTVLWKEVVLPKGIDVRGDKLLVTRRTTVEFRALPDGRVLRQIEVDATGIGGPSICRFVTDDLVAFAAGWKEQPEGEILQLWNLTTGHVAALADEISCITRISDAACLVGLESGDATYVDLPSGRTTRLGLKHTDRILSVDAATDGTVCVSSRDGTISVGKINIPMMK